MSKSTGNVISVHEALEKFSPDTLRMFFLSSHYRNPLMFSEQNIMAQQRAWERLQFAADGNTEASNGPELDVQDYKSRFIEAMDDDLNTPRALAALFDMSREINRGREEGQNVAGAQSTLKELAGVLGISLEESESESSGDIAPFVELLIQTRAELRAAKQ